MFRSRRMLLIGAVVLGVILVGVAVTLLTSSGSLGNRDRYRTTCDTFLSYMIAKDGKNSYAMLSDSAKRSDSQKSWSEKVVSLEYIYRNGKLTFNEKVAPIELQSTGEEGSTETASQSAEETGRWQLNYTLSNELATSDIECTALDNGGTYVIDGFLTSERQPDAETEQE